MGKKKILLVVGTRPNFIKMAPILKELKKQPACFDYRLVHTGQHFDCLMSDVFFRDLGLARPDIHLGVNSGSHAEQTARIMLKFEPVCLREKPDLVMVAGDVDSTLACALTASKLHLPVAHLEAGLRSYDRTMPEEINRLVTDAMADYLFVTCPEGVQHLLAEGVTREEIFFTGNTMIDTLKSYSAQAARLKTYRKLGLSRKKYALLTLHRPSNVDRKQSFREIWQELVWLSRDLPILFPIHPRTRQKMRSFSDLRGVAGSNLKLTPPLGYLEFLNLMQNAALVLTDSGGIQEETTFLGIPCLTLRSNTERFITVSSGTNTLIGRDYRKLRQSVKQILAGRYKKGRIPKFWDGQSAQRVVAVLLRELWRTAE